MTPQMQRLLRDLSALTPPRDGTAAEVVRFADAFGALQARAEISLEEELGLCQRPGCCQVAKVLGTLCTEHAAEVVAHANRVVL